MESSSQPVTVNVNVAPFKDVNLGRFKDEYERKFRPQEIYYMGKNALFSLFVAGYNAFFYFLTRVLAPIVLYGSESGRCLFLVQNEMFPYFLFYT